MTNDELSATRDMKRIAFEQAMDARKAAEAVEREAFMDWGYARIAYAKANPPALAGKAVKRAVVKRGTYGVGFRDPRTPDRTVWERGTVVLCEEPKGARYRVHDAIAGEWFVLSSSGQTAYSLTDRDGAVLWAIDE